MKLCNCIVKHQVKKRAIFESSFQTVATSVSPFLELRLSPYTCLRCNTNINKVQVVPSVQFSIDEEYSVLVSVKRRTTGIYSATTESTRKRYIEVCLST